MSNRSITSMEDDADVFLIVAREAVAAGEGLVPEGLVVGTLGHLSARLRREVREIIDAWAAKVAR